MKQKQAHTFSSENVTSSIWLCYRRVLLHAMADQSQKISTSVSASATDPPRKKTARLSEEAILNKKESDRLWNKTRVVIGDAFKK